MFLEELPSELWLEIFSYLHPADLHRSFSSLCDVRINNLLTLVRLSLDLTGSSLSYFELVSTRYFPSQFIFIRLTNQFSHGRLIADFFSSPHFSPSKFDQLRSLHLDDVIGDELDCLPPHLERLHINFHKKAKFAIRFCQIALASTTLKQCFLIGGYAFDANTCPHVSSASIERLHMAIKCFPNDLFALLQALPCLTRLKTRVYNRSTDSNHFCSSTASLTHLNIDLGSTGITLRSLHSHLLSHLPDLQSLIYQSWGRSTNDDDDSVRLFPKLKRFQFIRKSSSSDFHQTQQIYKNTLIAIAQENSNTSSRRLLQLHTIPYPDKFLHLPFAQWNKCYSSIDEKKQVNDEEVYDRVQRVRINLNSLSIVSDFPRCRYVRHLTLISENNKIDAIDMISRHVRLSSVRHLTINGSVPFSLLRQLFSQMTLHSLDITWSQLRFQSSLSTITNLYLTGEYVSWREIDHLLIHLMPQLKHLQMNTTTSEECQRILDVLLSLTNKTHLISIKVCVCQTLSDQIRLDLEPILSSSLWANVKWQMDSWYLYIWK